MKFILIAIGFAVLALCIQNRAKIAGLFTGRSWKTALWWVGGIALLPLAAWGIYLGHWSAWWNKIIAWPYWLYVFVAIPVLVAIIASARGGAKVGDGLKKFFDLLIALAKLVALIALIAMMFIFIVGPRYFWGEPSVVQLAQPAAQTQTRTLAPTPEFPKEFRVSALPGNLQDPNAPWSAPVRFAGRRGAFHLVGSGVPIAVKTESEVFIIAPGTMPHLGTPERLQFLSLANHPLEIIGRVE